MLLNTNSIEEKKETEVEVTVNLESAPVHEPIAHSKEEISLLLTLRETNSKLLTKLNYLKGLEENKGLFQKPTILENMIKKRAGNEHLAYIGKDDPVFKQTILIYEALKGLKKGEDCFFEASEIEYLEKIFSIRLILSTFNTVLPNSINKEDFISNAKSLVLFTDFISTVYSEALIIFKNKKGSYPNPFSTAVEEVVNQDKYKTPEEMENIFSIQRKSIEVMLERFKKLDLLSALIPLNESKKGITLILQLLALHDLPLKENATKSLFLKTAFLPDSPRIADMKDSGISENNPIIISCCNITINYIRKMRLLERYQESENNTAGNLLYFKTQVEDCYANDKAEAESLFIIEIAKLNNMSTIEVFEHFKEHGLLESNDIRKAAETIKYQNIEGR